jgi:Fe-S cluster assembly ATP-binding protein
VLKIKNLSVSIEDKQLINNLSLTIDEGTVHACMGPNGSGKSSLTYALMGHPNYKITQGSILLNDTDITSLTPDKRAKAGLFLSLQQPYAIPGVVLSTFLRESFRALYPDESLDTYLDRLSDACTILKFERSFLDRAVHEGFSGGEKKRCEMLQLLILQPKLAILDEIDSGLDVDALKCVAAGLQAFKKQSPQSSIFLITHYQRILDYITPEVVHILQDGQLVQSGDASLVTHIEKHGYKDFE